MTNRIKALIMDADGVTQYSTRGSFVGWVRLGGPGFLRALRRAEDPSQSGGVAVEPLIAKLLAERGLEATVEQVLAHWCRIDLDPAVLRLVDKVREAGVRTAMGTNQNPARGRYMLEQLPYAEHFDLLFHSWQIGYAKPAPGFYAHIIKALGVEPGEAVFVDDTRANVVAAAEAGLLAVRFAPLDTVGDLRRRLRRLGVPGL